MLPLCTAHGSLTALLPSSCTAARVAPVNDDPARCLKSAPTPPCRGQWQPNACIHAVSYNNSSTYECKANGAPLHWAVQATEAGMWLCARVKLGGWHGERVLCCSSSQFSFPFHYHARNLKAQMKLVPNTGRMRFVYGSNNHGMVR